MKARTCCSSTLRSLRVIKARSSSVAERGALSGTLTRQPEAQVGGAREVTLRLFLRLGRLIYGVHVLFSSRVLVMCVYFR